MNSSAPFLSPSDAAAKLGISTKALRLYEQRGLIAPVRTAAGWRAYGRSQMERAAEIVALRSLGLSLSHVARVLQGNVHGLEQALAAHQSVLESRIPQIAAAVEKVRNLRVDLAQDRPLALQDLVRLGSPAAEAAAAFDLPWPWGGERFELRDLKPITYIIGPLGSGKTRLARRLAETLTDAAFLGLDRLETDAGAVQARLDADPSLKERVDRALGWLFDEGAESSEVLTTLLAALEGEPSGPLVVDMVEQGLSRTAQEALIAHLRNRGPSGRPLFLLTRSSSILDLAAVGPNEAIILCPANHSPPTKVVPYPGAPGYEAVATCLASPDVRARTAGVVAWKSEAV